MQNYKIETDSDGRELITHGTEDFPCAFYDERFSEFVSGEVPWHWHDEIEMVLVVEGDTKLECIGSSQLLSAGEMVLINSGVLHRLTDVGERDCRILNIVFSPELIGGAQYSLLFSKYVRPLVNNASFAFYPFSADIEWQGRVITEFTDAFKLWHERALGFELAMTAAILQSWKSLCINEPRLITTQVDTSIREVRIQKILRFVHKHFSEHLSMATLSDVANISESECYRLFKATLGCTPNSYLVGYRLRRSLELLADSALPVTDIAYQCGFNSPAYFTKKFREAYAKTPREYRKVNSPN